MDFENFVKEYQKVPVECFPHHSTGDPLVSVCVTAYQHVNYITDCLEGILKQQTDFAFELLLGEDDSTDGTREICIEYAKKYPERIRLFLHCRENNMKYAGNFSGKFNFIYNLLSAKGKYIALCDGDDYWTDPLKLKTQVATLQNNPEASMCTHESHHKSHVYKINLFRRFFSIINFYIKNYGFSGVFQLCETSFKDNNFWFHKVTHDKQKRKGFYTLNDLADGKLFTALCSVMMTRQIINPIPNCLVSIGGAHQVILLLGAMRGGIVHLKNIMAIKRDQESSITKDTKRKNLNKIKEKNPGTSTRIKRYECLKKFADDNQKLILDQMINDYIKKISSD